MAGLVLPKSLSSKSPKGKSSLEGLTQKEKHDTVNQCMDINDWVAKNHPEHKDQAIGLTVNMNLKELQKLKKKLEK